MKLKILLFVAVAFVATSEALKRPGDIDSLLTGKTPYPTPASSGISGIAGGFQDVEDQMRRVDKEKGDTLLDTLKKLNNNTYSPPKDFKSCLKNKNDDIKKNLTNLTKEAKKAAKNIQKGRKELKELLKNYTEAFKGVEKKLWTPLKKEKYDNACKGLESTEKDMHNAMKDVMVKLVEENRNSSDSDMSNFNGVNKKWTGLKTAVNSTIIDCLKLGSS